MSSTTKEVKIDLLGLAQEQLQRLAHKETEAEFITAANQLSLEILTRLRRNNKFLDTLPREFERGLVGVFDIRHLNAAIARNNKVVLREASWRGGVAGGGAALFISAGGSWYFALTFLKGLATSLTSSLAGAAAGSICAKSRAQIILSTT